VKQEQFLDVISREEAERRWRGAGDWSPLPAEEVPLPQALGRVLATDVVAPRDVPGFTRCNVDGFAVRAADTYGATEERPRVLVLSGESVATGVEPKAEVRPGTATQVATGAMVPRGADAVVMVEDTEAQSGALLVRRAVVPGAGITHAGSDVARGETALRAGAVLTSRETGVLAALGVARVSVVRRPRVAVISTGDEVAPPGAPLREGMVHDANGRLLADAVREAGGEALERGIAPDDEAALWSRIETSLGADLVLLSGGTSKGQGDLCHRVLRRRGRVLVHGVALKPGKPLVLAFVEKTPVVVLPGFPTSAIFTFHEFVAPWIRARAGLPEESRPVVRARLSRAVASEIGRTEYVLVHLVEGAGGLVAYPLGSGSGSVTTFSRADGFFAVPAATERLEAEEEVSVTLLAPLRLPDLVVVGSHCTGLDVVLSLLRRRGFTSKVIAVGSTAGLEAARRGECDAAPVHLFDPATKRYNDPFLDDSLVLVPGYRRRQGVVSRDGREEGRMINRNRGSGTRALVDQLLGDRRPEGYELEVRSHEAVAAAVRSGRADWGVAIENVARGLRFRFLAEERFDFLVPKARFERPAVRAFRAVLDDPETRQRLREAGFLA
jgi:putative molybdopterin biosynthesis protein